MLAIPVYSRCAVVQTDNAAKPHLAEGVDHSAVGLEGRPVEVLARALLVVCPGREPPFLAVKSPVRPYKSTIQTRFTVENASATETPRAGPDSRAPTGTARSSPCHAAGRSGTLPARAGNHRFWLLSTPRAHTKAPYKSDLLRETLRSLKRPGRARTVAGRRLEVARAGAAHLARVGSLSFSSPPRISNQ